MSMLPPPVPQPARTWGPLDAWGTLVRCDLTLDGEVRNPYLRYVHDGSMWWIASHDKTLATFPTADVASVEITETWTETRERPSWATVLGVIGLLFFLIGVFFFFIKETRQVRTALVEVKLRDGRMITFMPMNADPAILRAQLRR